MMSAECFSVDYNRDNTLRGIRDTAQELARMKRKINDALTMLGRLRVALQEDDEHNTLLERNRVRNTIEYLNDSLFGVAMEAASAQGKGAYIASLLLPVACANEWLVPVFTKRNPRLTEGEAELVARRCGMDEAHACKSAKLDQEEVDQALASALE